METYAMQQQISSAEAASIHPGTTIGRVELRVADLERSLQFYQQVLYFRLIERIGQKAVLGTEDGSPLLVLDEVPGASPQPRRSTGLYHFAILVPGRPDLGRVLLRLADAGIAIGQADHLVSEALYLSDPDRNGIEVYRDRPRDTWHWQNGLVQMATDPLDLQAIANEGLRDAGPWESLPSGTRIGHMHLQVADIPQAAHFYHTILGFDITQSLPGALFVSAGGYHHHIGLNTWNSRGADPAPENTAGLRSFEIVLPHQDALAAVRARLIAHHLPIDEQEQAIVVADPWRNRIRLALPSSTDASLA